MLSWSVSLVDSIVNKKGSKLDIGSPVFLSFISSVSVAVSPSLRGDFDTRVKVISFWVIKCCAISLRFSRVSDNFSLTIFCTIGGTVGVMGIMGVGSWGGDTISGKVGTTGGIVSGTVGVTIGVVGVVIIGVLSEDGWVSIAGDWVVPVSVLQVFTMGTTIGISVLLL